MGRKSKWLSAVRKAFTHKPKEKKGLKLEDGSSSVYVAIPSLLPPREGVKLFETATEQNAHDTDVSIALKNVDTAVAVVQSTKVNKFVGRSKQEVAAIKIQTAFRRYIARRALRALRGLLRLKSLLAGSSVKRQTVHSLRCMQTLSRVQAQINSRRIRMSEEKQALQRQKHAKELGNLRIGEEWDDSTESKEQIEAKLLNKYEAAMRRERALAYAFSHQQSWKNSTRSANSMFMTLGNPSWGWSWLERWMEANTIQVKSTVVKELNNDHNGMRGEISKSSPPSPLTPSKPPSSALARKLKSPSRRSRISAVDDDANSMVSMQSEQCTTHSIGGAYIHDDQSLGSSHAVPSYMVPTASARAKSRLAPEKQKGPATSRKKQLSYPPSPPKPRLNFGTPKAKITYNTQNSYSTR